MPQVYVPGGSYRLHNNPVDMARMRIANGFGLRGLMGMGDPRSIPARGPSVVLPLVRGRDGWFYLSDGKRAQDRGHGHHALGWLGDAAADYAAQAANYTPGSPSYQFLMGCSQNPSAPACAANVSAVLSTPFLTASQEAAVRSAQAAGGTAPTFAANAMTATPQEMASAITGKPNQSVPPRDTSAPLPTGTGASGGNPVLNGNTGGGNPPPSSNTGLLVLGLGLAALFLLGRK